MDKRKIETILVFAATSLFGWGITRSIARGEPALHSWSTQVMIGLVVLSAVNIRVRSRSISQPIFWLCISFAVVVLLVPIMAVSNDLQFGVGAMVRALLFFICLGAAAWIQTREPAHD